MDNSLAVNATGSSTSVLDSLRLPMGLSLLLNVGGAMATPFMPDQDEIPAFAYVLTVVVALGAILGAYGLWRSRRWGSRVTIAVAVLNIIQVPGVVGAPNGVIGTGIAIGVVLSIVIIVLLRRQAVRRQLV